MPPNYRRCISCRQVAPRSCFWRVVRRHPDGTVHLDQGMGRSAYLCPKVECLRRAERKNHLGRSLRANIPISLFAQLWERLEVGSELGQNLSKT
ncbi:MAG: YlxR family protein [Cyanobacteriota bacterium]|nr:YlxR family protein [Cyanobacteriota bacterium]